MSDTERLQRNTSLDAIAGFFILLMMFQHFGINTRAPYTIGHIFMFNTSWFFFKSGMFHKPAKLTAVLIMKWVKRLIVPFVIFSVVGCAIGIIATGDYNNTFRILIGMFGQIAKYGAPWWNIPVWFLLTLFIVKIVTISYRGGTVPTVLLSIALLLLTFAHHTLIVDSFNYIGNSALAAFFYIIGYKSTQIKISWLIYAFMFGISLISIYLCPTAIDIWGNRPLYGNYLFCIIATLCGMLLINKLFNVCKFLAIKPFVFFGQNAMIFLVCHVPIALAVQEVWGSHSTLNHSLIQWIEAGIAVSVSLLIYLWFDRNKKYRWMIGG